MTTDRRAYIGDGQVQYGSEGSKIILPKGTEFIMRTFWKEPEMCKIYYDRLENCLYIVPKIRSGVKMVKGRLNLHEAIALVIYENNNKPMKPSKILNRIIERDLYRKKDGTHPDLHQIHARISNYSEGNKKGNSEYFRRTNEGIILTDKGIKLAEKFYKGEHCQE